MNYWIHHIDPIAFSFGGFAFPWYWLVYFFGGLWCLWAIEKIGKLDARSTSLVILWGWPLMLLCSRLFFVLIYQFDYYRHRPEDILAFWKGGMSFHGGMIGLITACFIVSKKENIPFLSLTRGLALTVPPVLGLGRIGNFINGELAGRPSSVPWAMIFPRYDLIPRHPSQLYEAFGEGPVLWAIMLVAYSKQIGDQRLNALFLISYGSIRFILEFFRLPDIQLGLFWHLSLGQLLCLIMIASGAVIYRKKAPALP